MEFEIIDIKKKRKRIEVEIEIPETRERKRYGYPLGDGWQAEIDGEPRFIKDIRKKLKKEEEMEKTDLDMSRFKKFKNSKFKTK